MENNVVNINSAKRHKKAINKVNNSSIAPQTYSFQEEVDKDIQKLVQATGLTEEEAVAMATDFYRKYPMLMEFVRSPEHLLRK